MTYPWELPLGARPLDERRVEFRVWAPRASSVAVRLAEQSFELEQAGYGVHQRVLPVRTGDDYLFMVDGQALPDPCSRWQPSGLRGPSRVVDPRQLCADESAFAPPPLEELVIYELHVGTFTTEGTFAAAARHMPELARLGVTAVEIMPVAEFPGRHGWGYDGVYISSPHSAYGGPEGFAELVAGAHRAGLAVILDVVYNHVGASGVTALEAFGPYFTSKYETLWGRAINFDGEGCDPVREWVLQSAAGWVRDYGVDGLRLDAIHAIYDSSPEHIVAAVARRVADVREDALVIAESGLNDPKVVRPTRRGGWGCAAVWADDFHHALWTLLTGERDGYYADFGTLAALAKAYRRPHVHDGRYSSFRGRRFGAPADDVPPVRFIVFSQNHDQVGNRAYGDRTPPHCRPLAAFCTVLAPFVPLLFMGEEYGELAPFQFFSDHFDAEIVDATREGRRREFAAFAQFREEIPDPQAGQTFARSKLTRHADPAVASLYQQLLEARRLLPRGDVDAVQFDEEARWLLVVWAPFELALNFSRSPRQIPCRGHVVELATHGQPPLLDGYIALPAMSGALIR